MSEKDEGEFVEGEGGSSWGTRMTHEYQVMSQNAPIVKVENFP